MFPPLQGPSGIPGPKGQRGERVCVMCVIIQTEFCIDFKSGFRFFLSLFLCVSTQGEPGYAIAGLGANFVPGPAVSLEKI